MPSKKPAKLQVVLDNTRILFGSRVIVNHVLRRVYHGGFTTYESEELQATGKVIGAKYLKPGEFKDLNYDPEDPCFEFKPTDTILVFLVATGWINAPLLVLPKDIQLVGRSFDTIGLPLKNCYKQPMDPFFARYNDK